MSPNGVSPVLPVIHGHGEGVVYTGQHGEKPCYDGKHLIRPNRLDAMGLVSREGVCFEYVSCAILRFRVVPYRRRGAFWSMRT
jgi:hypothetical protein